MGGLLAGLLLSSILHANDQIVSIRSSSVAVFAQAFKGFSDCLRKKNNTAPILDFLLSKKNIVEFNETINKIREIKPRVILAIGDSAAKHAKNNFPNIPIVYCMVVDPMKNNLPKSGITASVHPKDQINYIRTSFPLLRRIGIIYTADRNSMTIQELKKLSQTDKDLILKEVLSSQEVEKSLLELKKGGADCLLMLPNTKIYSIKRINDFIYYTLQLGFPIISFSPSTVKAGVLGSIYPDTRDNGCLASNYVNQILSGKTASGMSIQWPQKNDWGMNMRVAKRLKIQVNKESLKKAELVIK